MKDDELNQFSNQFINLWQENFSKAIADQKIVEMMMNAMANMQQFYDKPAPAAFTGTSATVTTQHDRSQLHDRIDELERRLSLLEGKAGKGKTASPKRGKN